jgi:hypothetical protein
MSSAERGCGACDPEAVFELADGQAGGKASTVMLHLEGCPGCRELYEREKHLNRQLGSFDGCGVAGRSVSRMVAMALPTRTARSRAVWAMLAVALSLSALLALEVSGRNPAILIFDATAWTSGALVGVWDVARILFAVVGRWVVMALIVGITLDLMIAAVVAAIFARRNRRTREA